MVNKWFSLQSASDIPGNVENVKKLLNHPAFDLRNPNKVTTLLLFYSPFYMEKKSKKRNGSKWFRSLIFLNFDFGQVHSLIGGFCASPVNFHAKDGSGYKFLGDLVLQLDKLIP